jgi:hypothetical protein
MKIVNHTVELLGLALTPPAENLSVQGRLSAPTTNQPVRRMLIRLVCQCKVKSGDGGVEGLDRSVVTFLTDVLGSLPKILLGRNKGGCSGLTIRPDRAGERMLKVVWGLLPLAYEGKAEQRFETQRRQKPRRSSDLRRLVYPAQRGAKARPRRG